MTSAESPCTKVCKINEHKFCLGCGRSLNEIAGWRTYTAAEKQQVNKAAKQRIS
jgi:predicted Fe-S protein YdhL (DUF1289 family)